MVECKWCSISDSETGFFELLFPNRYVWKCISSDEKYIFDVFNGCIGPIDELL